jgi:hypothetical protein
MSWWDTTTGEDSIIGDRPADIMGTALQDIDRTWFQQTGQRPTLQQLVDVIAVSMRTNFEAFCCDAMGASVERIVVRLKEPPDLVSEGIGIDTDCPLVVRLSEAIADVVQVYKEKWERKPRLIEILENFTFIMGGGHYLLNGQAVEFDEIYAQLDREVTNYWWKLEVDDNLLGHQPGSIVAGALSDIPKTYEEQRRQLPTIQELADAIAKTLNTHLEEFCVDGGNVLIESVDIWFDFEDEPISSQVDNRVDEQLVLKLSSALTEVVKVYQEQWGRQPKIRELVKTFRWALVVEPPSQNLSLEKYVTVNDVTAQLGKKYRWWDIENDGKLGERPIEIVEYALETIARTYEEARGQHPTLQELTDAIAFTLNTEPKEFCSDLREVGVQTVTVRFDTGANVISNMLLLTTDEQTVIALYNTFEEIANVYHEQWKRQPNLKELLETIKFVLTSNTDNYISNASGNSIEAVVAELGQEYILAWEVFPNVGFVSYQAIMDLDGALQGIVRIDQEQEKRPTGQELVDAIAAALRRNLETICSDSREVFFQRLVVKLEDKLPLVASGENKTADDPLVIGFTNASENIAKIYEERWARKPTLKEVLTIVDISLGTNLRYYVSDADDQTYIDGIVVE